LIAAAGDGKIGFISDEDIAEIGVELITAAKMGGVERIIIGPELLSYEDVRIPKNSHVHITNADMLSIDCREALPSSWS
jgi:hypothetical protein